jgi:hypothetical protein
MASQLGQVFVRKGTRMATKHFLDKQLAENSHRSPGGPWDPYFEYRPDKKGRMKKHRKQIPDYIPTHDAEILAKVRKWAYRLDVKMSFLGMRFGWAAVIGSIPEVGDALDVILSIYVYHMCRKVDGGLDLKTKSKMKAWILTDGLIGTIPFIGDIIDASIKCRARNCRLLEEFLDAKYQPKPLTEREDRLRQDPDYTPHAPATVYEDHDDDPPAYASDVRRSDRESGHGRRRISRRH